IEDRLTEGGDGVDLTTLPLWTGNEWVRSRPVHAVDDSLVGSGLTRAGVPVWEAPLSLAAIPMLTNSLGVSVVELHTVSSVGVTPDAILAGRQWAAPLASALGHLRTYLIQHDPT